MIITFGILLQFAVAVATPANGSAGPCAMLRSEIQNEARTDVAEHRPESATEALLAMFEKRGAQCGMDPATLVRTYRSEYRKAAASQPFWSRLDPKGGWILAAILLLIAIFRDVVKTTVTDALTALKGIIYARFAGSRVFRRTALRRYRDALHSKYANVIVPFRSDIRLDMSDIYVPLRLRSGRGADDEDAGKLFGSLHRLMVIGAPGSGKSMLLRNVAFRYSHAKVRSGTPIPVVVELNRLNEGESEIQPTIVEIFKLNDFPHAEVFVESALARGDLYLLFDGLDEVNTARRDTVVAAIQDFLTQHRRCRAIITCRAAVYRNEFAADVQETFEVVEFNDAQVRRFLNSWRSVLPTGKDVDQLLETLRNRPRIMALARNPLLLTIIAFLYTEPSFLLPSSRAEFYDYAVDVLLSPKIGVRNEFKAPHKKLILEHLALFNQDAGTGDQQDRRSIDLTVVLREITTVLPQLNLAEDKAQPILDEIIERSGLLLSIDGGTRCQFAHLTLQEFFAASALKEAAHVIERYARDPDAWRETAKLWCGFNHDCTKVIEYIRGVDPITAFECLADAQQVLPALADATVADFKQRIEQQSDDAAERAFGAVAADDRPRGKATFEYLAKLVRNAERPAVQLVAANALALTYLPEAARVIAEACAKNESLYEPLVALGDLAIPHLERGATVLKSAEAVRLLYRIGTPRAATALVEYIFSALDPTSTQAAWYVCSLLRQTDVEETLRGRGRWLVLSPDNAWEWVWKPFAVGPSDALTHIIPLCAEFIADGVAEPVPIDSRVAMAVTLQLIRSLPTPEARDRLTTAADTMLIEGRGHMRPAVLTTDPITGHEEAVRQDDSAVQLALFQKILQPETGGATILKLLPSIPASIRLQFVTAAASATQLQWESMFDDATYEFGSGYHVRTVVALAFALSLVAAYGIIRSPLPVWCGALSLSALVIAWAFIFAGAKYSANLRYDRKPTPFWIRAAFVGLGVLYPLLVVIMSIVDRDKDVLLDGRRPVLFSMPFWPASPVVAWFASAEIARLYGRTGTILTWVPMVAISITLILLAFRAEKRAQNPFNGFLQPSVADAV